MINLDIRPEKPDDYSRIAQLHVRAFDNRITEATMIALQRQSSFFDPELSIVAALNGQVVGHVLFSPLIVRMLEEDVPAVLLAPIAVDPDYQQQGIGGKLLSEGHHIASTKGYRFSFLIGHPDYYPKFGYKQFAFGVCTVDVTPQQAIAMLDTRRPKSDDIPRLIEIWRHEENAVDFAIYPGDTISDWLSPNPQIEATVYLQSGEIVGFTRIDKNESCSPRMFIARNHEIAQLMVSQISVGSAQIHLPLHPQSASTAAFNTNSQVTCWEVAMVLPLRPSSFDLYYEKVLSSRHLCGRPIFPVAFDME